MQAPGPDGKPTEWSVECSSPNTLSRQGWKPSTFKPGDKGVGLLAWRLPLR